MESAIIETLEGCISVLEGMDEERHDPRHWALMSALQHCVDVLEDADESEEPGSK